MTRRTSQNPLPRDPPPKQSRHRQILSSLIATLTFLAGLGLAVDQIPHTNLGRTITSHLDQLADPASWFP